MDELRYNRYRDKINYIIDNIREFSKKPKTRLEKKGLFYSAQTSIESMVDLIAMAVKDLGISVKDDKKNVIELVNIRNLNRELGSKLIKAIGLRNLLVHRYNSINENIILKSLNELENLLIQCG